MIFGFNKEKTQKSAERYVQQGKYPAAIEEYKKILEYDPEDINTANTIGDLCVRVGRTQDAVRYFLRCAEHYEAARSPLLTIGMLKKVVKADPTNGDIAVRLADLYIRQKLVGDARQLLAAAAEAYKVTNQSNKAVKTLRKLASLEPDNVALRVEIAERCVEFGQTGEAIDELLGAGREFVRLDAYAEALKAFERVLALNPDSSEAQREIAHCYSRLGRLEEAFRLLEDQLREYPDDAELHAALGEAYLNAGMLDSARAAFTRLLEFDRTRVEPLFDVADGYVRLGELASAYQILDLALEPLLELKLKKRATALLKSALQRDPNSVDALRRLAEVYARVREKRNLVTTLNLLVESALRLGLQREAEAALRRLVAIEPSRDDHKTRLARLEDERPKVAPSDPEFIPGFESAPALMEWSRRKSGPSQADDMEGMEPPERPVSTAEAVDSYADFSTELLEDMVTQSPDFLRARVKLLEDVVASQPDYLEGRLKLKQHYIDAHLHERAAAQCLEIARIYEKREVFDAAREHLAEAYRLVPNLAEALARLAVEPERGSAESAAAALHQFNRDYDREWRRAARDGRPISLVRVGLDNYASYAELYGSLSADYLVERVLNLVEAMMQRPGDAVSSAGDGEFLVILPETDEPGALTVADRIRGKVASMRIAHAGSPLAEWVTASAGVATAHPEPTSNPDDLKEKATEALRAAARQGNHVEVLAPGGD